MKAVATASIILVLSVTLGACGGSDSGPPPKPSTSAPEADGDKELKGLGDLADTLEDQDVDLTNPTFRKSYITGMTTQGVPEKLANCIVDKAIEQKLTVTDLVDPQAVQKLATACS